jgi:hypothetical protein
MISKRKIATITLVTMITAMLLSLSTWNSNAQLSVASTPIRITENPWTFRLGHCTDDGNYPNWCMTPGPGPLSDHILWKANTYRIPGYRGRCLVFNGRLFGFQNCWDAVTGEQLWSNPEAMPPVSLNGYTAGWIPKNIQQKLAWWSPMPTYMRVTGADEDMSDGYIYGIVGAGPATCVHRINVEDGTYTKSAGGMPGMMYPLVEYDYYFDFDLGIMANLYMRLFGSAMPMSVGCIEYDYGRAAAGFTKLWDGLSISAFPAYPIAPLAVHEGPGYIMAPGAAAFTRPSDDVIHGLEAPATQEEIEFLRRYWTRYSWTACQSIVTSSNKGILYTNGPAHGCMLEWIDENMTMVSHGTGHEWITTFPSPWWTGDDEAMGLMEYYNGQFHACDWDYTTESCRSIDSGGWLMAQNKTDGTVIWRRVGAKGCMGNLVDDANNRLYTWTAGGYIKCYNSVTGEDIWWWHHEDYQEADDQRCLGEWAAYDGEDIYVVAWNGNVYKVDGTTGQTIWSTQTGGMQSCGGRPIVSLESNIVYLSMKACRGWRVPELEPGMIYALDKDTGEVVWKKTDIWAEHDFVVADGRMYVRVSDVDQVYCYGQGPTKTTLDLSTTQVKGGETILISGQVLDQSPESSGNFNAPCTDVPVRLFYTPLGGVEVADIATVNTGYAGDYYYEWTVPDDVQGMFSVVANFAGSVDYETSSGQVNFRLGAAELSTEELVEQITEATGPPALFTTGDILIIAAVAVTLVIVVYIGFIKREK